jgi:hypothetical protein
MPPMTAVKGFRRRAFLGLTGALAVWPVTARAGWLDTGKDMLKSLGGADGGGSLSEAQIGKGLKAALEVASERVVTQVGQIGGYLDDPAIHIPLPGYLAQARNLLSTVGAADLLTDLETKLNRAAETAAPQAQEMFLDAIGQMTMQDAREILGGPDDAATQYFKRTMSPELRETFRPVVDAKLAETGAIQTLDETVAAYDKIPFAGRLAKNAQGRLVDHGLDGALSGLFHYMAKEEAAIRNDPAKRTTDLLKQVFGA